MRGWVLLFWWRPEVIWCHSGSNSNYVHMISRDRRLRYISNLVFWCIIEGEPYFLVDDKSHLQTLPVKLLKLYLYEIWTRITWIYIKCLCWCIKMRGKLNLCGVKGHLLTLVSNLPLLGISTHKTISQRKH